jgi:hypothetical protein
MISLITGTIIKVRNKDEINPPIIAKAKPFSIPLQLQLLEQWEHTEHHGNGSH